MVLHVFNAANVRLGVPRSTSLSGRNRSAPIVKELTGPPWRRARTSTVIIRYVQPSVQHAGSAIRILVMIAGILHPVTLHPVTLHQHFRRHQEVRRAGLKDPLAVLAAEKKH